MTSFNDRIIEEFRGNRGKVGGPFAGFDLLLLTTIGARSGERRTNPLAYVRYEGHVHVSAAHRGAARHPDWYFNLVADREVGVETGVEEFHALAQVLTGMERKRVWDFQAKQHPEFEEYAERAGREIPVVRLLPRGP